MMVAKAKSWGSSQAILLFAASHRAMVSITQNEGCSSSGPMSDMRSSMNCVPSVSSNGLWFVESTSCIETTPTRRAYFLLIALQVNSPLGEASVDNTMEGKICRLTTRRHRYTH